MRIEITKEWCLNMARIEGPSEIGAGLHALDPIFDGEMVPKENNNNDPSIAFGRFVQLMRREKGLSLEKLAEDTDLEISELVEIEEDNRHKPELRTVFQLANYFKVPRNNLLQVAGLTQARNDNLAHEAVRFAARSESVAVLTKEERMALEEFVGILSKE